MTGVTGVSRRPHWSAYI